jgi:predicted DNA-binding transcriptional regulator AlpA
MVQTRGTEQPHPGVKALRDRNEVLSCRRRGNGQRGGAQRHPAAGHPARMETPRVPTSRIKRFPAPSGAVRAESVSCLLPCARGPLPLGRGLRRRAPETISARCRINAIGLRRKHQADRRLLLNSGPATCRPSQLFLATAEEPAQPGQGSNTLRVAACHGAPKFSAHKNGAPKITCRHFIFNSHKSRIKHGSAPGASRPSVISHFHVDAVRSLIYAQNQMDHRTFLKSSEVARTLGISRRTLALWVKEGRIPEPQKSPAGYFRWTEADLLNVRGLTKRSPGPQPGTAVRRKKRAA